MADFFAELSESHNKFIAAQPVFFVATAPGAGRINLSPKGLDTFRILGANRVAYLDITGSGNETAAHILDDGRITLMFMSFSRNARILRIYGRGSFARPGSDEYEEHIGLFPAFPGVRQIIFAEVESVSTSCGFGVPEMQLLQPRTAMGKWAEAKGAAGIRDYQEKENAKSIDGLPTGLYD
jgi:hypothetical protein